MSKSTNKQFLVKVQGIEGYFASFSGGRVASDARKVYDGGSLVPDVLSAPAQVENFTVSRHYDYQRDGDLVRVLKTQVGIATYTVSKTPTNASLVPVGPPETYVNCRLVGVNQSDVNSESGDPAMYELEFAPSAVV